ncbi:MAG: glycosyltransferase family 4 protein [Phycisphaerae bacterium]|nr:glycosyltransferase family 4 protein [Phycisphaerae bacterium]
MKNSQKNEKAVLIISNSFLPSTGGVQTHLDDLCRHLLSSDKKVFVVTCQPDKSKTKSKYIERSENCIIVRMPVFGMNLLGLMRLKFLYENILLFLGSFFVILRYYSRIKTIHGHGFAFYLKPLKLLFPSKRFVLSTHNLYHFPQHGKLRNSIVRWALFSNDFVLTVSKQSRDELVKAGFDSEKITVFHQWVNQEKFKPFDKVSAKKRLGWQGRFIALFVGRFELEKGAELLMQVADKTCENITFAFIGDGPMAEQIKEQASDRKNAVFIGKVKNEDIPSYLNAADVLVVPSQWEEPMGRVVLEAFACGLPVIATARGGMPETITSDVGILVSPPEKDVENISKAVNQLYNDQDKLRYFSKNAVTLINEKYSHKNAELIVGSYS